MGIRDRAYMHHREAPPTSPRPAPPTLSWRIVILLVIVIGLGSWYRLHQSSTPVVQPATPAGGSLTILPANPFRAQVSRYQPYLNAITPESDTLRALAYSKVKSCPPADRTCIMTELFRFVQHDIGYLSDPVSREHIQSPQATLTIGAGDCEDLSILLASLLDNVGIPNYLAFTDDHAYVMACGVDPERLAPTLENRYATEHTPTLHAETRLIQPHALFVTTFPFTVSTQVEIDLNGTTLFDWMVVPSRDEVEALTQHRTYQVYSACSRTQITSFRSTCTVPVGAQLVAFNTGDTPLELNVGFRYQRPPVKPALPALATESINGAQCLPLDPSIKGQAYPGQLMPTVTTARSRTAVNRAGHLVVLQ